MPSGPITDCDLDILDALLRYKLCSAAQLVRLVGGDEDVTHRRLRRLWERGLINRWAFPGIRTHSEFYYYPDSREPLSLLTERRGAGNSMTRCWKKLGVTRRCREFIRAHSAWLTEISGLLC